MKEKLTVDEALTQLVALVSAHDQLHNPDGKLFEKADTSAQKRLLENAAEREAGVQTPAQAGDPTTEQELGAKDGPLQKLPLKG